MIDKDIRCRMPVYSLDDGGNELPSEIRDQLISLRKLDDECAELDRKLQEVRNRRDAVYRQLEQFCESRAPIRRVPYEVLAIIFNNHPETQKSRNSSLMQVCKQWRRMVIDTPRLWNHISLDLGRIDELPALWTYARACLIRSGSMPLYIRLDARNFNAKHSLLEVGATFTEDYFAYIYNYQGDADTTLRQVVDFYETEDDVVRAHECALLMTLAILRGEDDRFLTRWRTFHCYLGMPFDESELVDLEAARLWDSMYGITDKLVDLVFLLDYSYSPLGDWRPKGFPNMNSLQGFSTSLDIDLDRLSLPIATLERLCLFNHGTSENFLDFRSDAFTSLRLLELVFYVLVDHDSRQTINLPALEVLALAGGGYQPIMGQFNAPKLTHLGLKYLQYAEQETPSIFNTITDVMWTFHGERRSEELKRLLSFTPSLRRIHIRREYGIPDIAPALEVLKAERGSTVDYTEDPADWPYVVPDWDL